MQHSPLVSILIPLYNAEKYIAQTIESGLAQTWPNKEIIVINDGSTDNSLKVARSFENRGVIVIDQPNAGCSAAKQAAYERSKGDFIQYLDADDILSPDKIAAQMELLLQQPHKLAVCRTAYFFDEEDYRLSSPSPNTYFLDSLDDPIEFLIRLYGGNGQGGMIQPNAFLTPRTIADQAGPWDISISPSPDEDGEYFCRIILASQGVVYSQKGINYYRKRRKGGSLAGLSSHRGMKGALRSLELKGRHLLSRTNDERARMAVAASYFHFAIRTFCYYRDLSEQALRFMEDLRVMPPIPRMGGPILEIIKHIFGWKMASLCSFYYRNLLSKL